MRLTDLSDDELLSTLKSLNGKEQQILAHVIAYLAEVDERRLHLQAACSSLFDFCVRRLGMSEGEAFRRITAARLVRRFPGLLARIAKGEIHLSALVLLRDHLTPENHEPLVSAAAGQSKRKVQELVASRFPKPDVPTTIRRLPAPPAARSATSTPGTSAPATNAPATSTLATSTLATSAPATSAPALPYPVKAPVADAPATRELFESPADVMARVAATPAAEPPSRILPIAPSPRHMEDPSANTAMAVPTPSRTPTSVPASKPATIEPLSEARHKVQLTVSTEVREKLERAMALLRHRNPSGDLAVVLERAVDLLLADLEKEILGKLTRPQGRPTASKATEPGSSPRSKIAAPAIALDGKVSRPARRAVFERDGEQCSYVDAEGNRCPSTSFLEIDHRRPRALGGDNKADNLQVVCRPHNQWLAEQAFGREHIAQQVRLRRQKSTPRTPAPTPPTTRRLERIESSRRPA